AAAVFLAAWRVLRTGAQLDRGLPAAVAAGVAGHAVADLRPRPPSVEPARRAVGGGGGAVCLPVRLPGQARADRSDGGVLHHARLLRAGPAPAAGAALALVLARLLRGRARGDHQGCGLPRPAGTAAVRVDALAQLAGVGRTRAPRRRALGAGGGGGPRRGGTVAGADAVAGAVRRRSRAPRLRRRPAVPPDRHPLRRRLAPPRAGLVLPAGGGGVVAAVVAAAAVAGQAVARGLARARWAGVVAAGDVRAGAAVFQPEQRQARHVHPAGAADAGAGGGAVPGRPARTPRR